MLPVVTSFTPRLVIGRIKHIASAFVVATTMLATDAQAMDTTTPIGTFGFGPPQAESTALGTCTVGRLL